MTTLLLEKLDRLIEAGAALGKDRATRKIERTLEPKVRAAFAKQERAFLKRLVTLKPSVFGESWLPIEEALDEDSWGKLFDESALETLEAFIGPITAAAGEALLAAGKYTIASLGVELAFDLKNPLAVRYLDEVGAEHVTKINEDTRGYLRTVISHGTAEGWSYDRIAKAISARFQEFRVGRPQQHIESRAHLIAVTEVGNAYEAGSFGLGVELQKSGLVMQKSWLITGGRVCPVCEGNAAQGWIPFDDAFGSGHERPLGHPSCRCTGLIRRRPSKEEE